MKKWMITCDRCGKEIHVAGEEQGYKTPNHIDTFVPYIKDKKWGQNFKSYELCQECFADVVTYILNAPNSMALVHKGTINDVAWAIKNHCNGQSDCANCEFFIKKKGNSVFRCMFVDIATSATLPCEWEVPDGEKR